MIKAIIFDWHGTIGEIKNYRPRNELKENFNLSKELFDKMNLDLFVTSEINENYVRNRLCEIIRVLPTKSNVDYILRNFSFKQTFEVYEEAKVVIPMIKGIFPVKIGLLSNIDPSTLSSLVSDDSYKSFFKKYFDSLFFSCKYKISKPDLRIFYHALSELDVLPEETLMVGDKPENDLLPAQKIGMKTFHVKMKEPKEPLDYSLRDVLDFIKECNNHSSNYK